MDFANAVEGLDLAGSNWVVFQNRFLIAIRQKKILGQFDGTNPKPSVLGEGATKTEKKTFVKELASWQDKEDLVHYLLTQKLPDLIFTKYLQKETVADIWKAIVKEFTYKSMLMQSNLHLEFMAMWYEALMNARVLVSHEDYCSLVINFVLVEISSFLAQLSAGMKVANIVQSKRAIASSSLSCINTSTEELDAEELMQLATKEWDRCKIAWKSRIKANPPSKANGTTLVMVASEKPGAKSGGSQGKKKQGKMGKCWTCGKKVT